MDMPMRTATSSRKISVGGRFEAGCHPAARVRGVGAGVDAGAGGFLPLFLLRFLVRFWPFLALPAQAPQGKQPGGRARGVAVSIISREPCPCSKSTLQQPPTLATALAASLGMGTPPHRRADAATLPPSPRTQLANSSARRPSCLPSAARPGQPTGTPAPRALLRTEARACFTCRGAAAVAAAAVAAAAVAAAAAAARGVAVAVAVATAGSDTRRAHAGAEYRDHDQDQQAPLERG